MKSVVIGAHLLRDDIEPVADSIPVGDLFLSALAVPDEQPLGDRELLVKVAELRGRLLDAATFIAIRYGFAVNSESEAAARCSGFVARWRELLIEHRGDVEMTLKVVSAAPVARPDRHAFASGAAYLKALRDARDSVEVPPAFRSAVERLIVPLAVRHRWMHRDERSIELAALVPRASLDDFRRAGESLRAEAGDVPFLLSGPWPLEVFTE